MTPGRNSVGTWQSIVFAEWILIHVKHVMIFRDRSPMPLMPMPWIFSIYKFGMWLESIRLRLIDYGNDGRLAARGDDYGAVEV